MRDSPSSPTPAQTRELCGRATATHSQKKHRTGTQNSCPILFRPLRVFPIVGRRVGQNFDLRRKRIFDKEKSPKTAVFGDFMELLGRFELPTSSLPSDKMPSSRCGTRVCGRFYRKKDEVGNSLLHVFRPLVSPCGSRCGSNNFQDANEGRTSDSGNPSRCALSRS